MTSVFLLKLEIVQYDMEEIGMTSALAPGEDDSLAGVKLTLIEAQAIFDPNRWPGHSHTVCPAVLHKT
jgi:hypothetical protein